MRRQNLMQRRSEANHPATHIASGDGEGQNLVHALHGFIAKDHSAPSAQSSTDFWA
jgi:hypothetical protein